MVKHLVTTSLVTKPFFIPLYCFGHSAKVQGNIASGGNLYSLLLKTCFPSTFQQIQITLVFLVEEENLVDDYTVSTPLMFIRKMLAQSGKHT